MKKLVVYYAGIWAERLLTVERYKEIAYFVDDADKDIIAILSEKWEKPVLKPEALEKENKDDIIIIISDNRLYDSAKEKLESMDFVEDKHFFNGWKLTFSFYKEFYGDNSWIKVESTAGNEIDAASFRYAERAEMMSKPIPDDVRSILDIGCGNSDIRRYIAPKVKYYGSDICKRDEYTILYDVNKDPLPKIDVDMYYMAGLIYYVDDVDHFISQMRNAKYILLDYSGIERWLRLDGVAGDPFFNARNNFFQ